MWKEIGTIEIQQEQLQLINQEGEVNWEVAKKTVAWAKKMLNRLQYLRTQMKNAPKTEKKTLKELKHEADSIKEELGEFAQAEEGWVRAIREKGEQAVDTGEPHPHRIRYPQETIERIEAGKFMRIDKGTGE